MRRTKYFIPSIFLLAAGLLAGCSTDDDLKMVDEGSGIRFNITEWQPMESTRATTQPAGILTSGSFKVDAFTGTTTTKYIDDQTVSYIDGEWKFANKHYWPQSDNLTFVAYYPTDFAYTCISKASPYYSYANGPSFVCTDLPMTNAGQYTLRELVYAVTKDQNKTGPEGTTGVSLAFRHPLAKLMLQVRNAHRKVTINKITFKNLYNNGTLIHETNTSTWTPTGSLTDLVIVPDPIADIDVNATAIANIANPFLVLPQSYTAAGQIEVKLQFWKLDDSGKEGELTITFNNPISLWEIGKAYTYTLDLGENVRFGVRVDNWNEGGIADVVNFTYDTYFMTDLDDWNYDGVGDAVSFSYDADFMLKVDDWENDGSEDLDYN